MRFQKALSAIMAVSMVAALSLNAFAWDNGTAIDSNPADSRKLSIVVTNPFKYVEGVPKDVYNKDGEEIDYIDSIFYNGEALTLDYINPGETVYIPIRGMAFDTEDGGDYEDHKSWISYQLGGGELDGTSASTNMYVPDFADDSLYSFKVKKETGATLVKSIEIDGSRKLTDADERDDYIKVIMNDSTMTSEKKFEATLTFTAKKTAYGSAGGDNKTLKNYKTGTAVRAGDKVELKLIIWVNNTGINGTDGDAEEGDRVYFDPAGNDVNTFIWGDDRAAVEFDANDSPDEFYARLSTATIRDIYVEYGDPVNADLYFYNFVGTPTIPSTARARVTLGIPWDDDDEINTAPENCYIYELDANGLLHDVTSSFTYSEGDEVIDGWTTLTRTLSTFIVSDTKLEIEDETVAPAAAGTTGSDTLGSYVDADSTVSADKKIPNTGSSDMVNLAVLGAVLSTAAAGVIAIKKATKSSK